MVKFSIIVPVYNVEKYLNNCIESLLNQKFDNFEIILVNDGSTDKSGLMCDNYASTNKNISVIHKDNGGLSDARNIGIANAKGEYIIFVDSDDFIEPESLKKFNELIEKKGKPDVIITRIKKFYEDSEPRYIDSSIPFEAINNGNKEDVVNWMFSYSNGLWPAQRYIVRRSLIQEKNLQFAVGYLHEDIDWTCNLFFHANTFKATDYYWYNHRVGRKGSITTNKKAKRTLDVIKLVSKNISDEQYNCLDKKTRDVMFRRMTKSLFASLSDYKYYDVKGKQEVIMALKFNKNVFKYTIAFRHKIFVIVSRIFGFKIALNIMSLL